MKRNVLTVLLMLFAVAGFSQISFNVKTGLNLSSYMGENTEDLGFKPGFRLGVGMEYQFTDLVSLQPTLFISQKGVKESTELTKGLKGDMTINQWYMELPVNAQLRFNLADDINLIGATGPYLAVGVAGKKKFEGGAFGESASVSYDTFGENAYRRFDAGWNIGIGVEINRFIVSLDTQLGFCKLYDSEDASRNVNIGLLVGYKF